MLINLPDKLCILFYLDSIFKKGLHLYLILFSSRIGAITFPGTEIPKYHSFLWY